MPSLLVQLYEFLLIALAAIAGAIVVVIATLIVYDVSLRTLGYRPPAYTLALVEYMLLYFALLASPWLVRTKKHIYVNAVLGRLPVKPRAVLEWLNYLVCTIVSATFAVVATVLLLHSVWSGQIDIRAIDMPMWLLYAPMPLTFGLMTIEFARYLFGYDRYYGELGSAPDSL